LRIAVVAADFVVIDEIGLNVDLTPGYGRSPGCQRAYAKLPRNTSRNTTLIGSCSLAAMGPGVLPSGGVDGATVPVDMRRDVRESAEMLGNIELASVVPIDT
jgi:hypothetical protein